jgi:hypothetical protein
MTLTVKTITVGHVTLELPTGMPSKEIQQLAGSLATLRRVESLGLWADDHYRNVHYVETSGPSIMLGELLVETEEEARRLHEEDKAARKAKEDKAARKAKETAAA